MDLYEGTSVYMGILTVSAQYHSQTPCGFAIASIVTVD
jgi:hypothetical protein